MSLFRMNKELIKCVDFGVGIFTFIPTRRFVHLIPLPSHFTVQCLHLEILFVSCLRSSFVFPRISFNPSIFKSFPCEEPILPPLHNFVLHLLTNPAPSAPHWSKTLHVKFSNLVFFDFALNLYDPDISDSHPNCPQPAGIDTC